MSWSSELKVGTFVLVGIGFTIGGYLWTFDGVRGSEASYHVKLRVPDANGLWEGTPVKIAGVAIGAVESIDIDGDRAVLDLIVREQWQLPTDSVAELRSSGMLGDRFVGVVPGHAPGTIPDGGRLAYGEDPGELDVIMRQVQSITADVQAITGALRKLTENDANREHLEASLANIDALTAQLEAIARENRSDINAITESIRRLSESMEGYTKDVAGNLEQQFDKLDDATTSLNKALADVASVTGKLDAGEGTIGALLNDRETIDSLNDTLDDVNKVVSSFTDMRTEVYYTHRYYIGTQPSDPAFFRGNPLSGGSNVLGMLLQPQDDFWWIFEINDTPAGVVNFTEHYTPELSERYTEWTYEPKTRWTFQMSKRWSHVSFRLGVKESGGGLGATVHAAHDRLKIEADMFDFALGSYPAIEAAGLPNTRLGFVWEPVDQVYVTGGAEQILLGARYGYATGFIGAGFHFTDDDIKLLFATLPIKF